MTSQQFIEEMWAAARAGEVWVFVFSMVTLLCMVIWYDIKKENGERNDRNPRQDRNGVFKDT